MQYLHNAAGFIATGAPRRRQGIGISAPLSGKSLPPLNIAIF
jgi:hypothetical protein